MGISLQVMTLLKVSCLRGRFKRGLDKIQMIIKPDLIGLVVVVIPTANRGEE